MLVTEILLRTLNALPPFIVNMGKERKIFCLTGAVKYLKIKAIWDGRE